jgi:hypothetical protein
LTDFLSNRDEWKTHLPLQLQRCRFQFGSAAIIAISSPTVIGGLNEVLDSVPPAARVLPGYSLVTVVFEAEFELLCLQARSVALYGSAEILSEIFVLDNFDRGMSVRHRARLTASYGAMSDLVRILGRDEFPLIGTTNGYITQQLLKLLVADVVATEHYVILDAKSHIIRPLHLDFFQSLDGRPRIRIYPYTFHPLRRQLLDALDLFGLDHDSCLAAFAPTVPPFTIVTSIARRLIHSDPEQTGQGFVAAFSARGLTEFFCYSAYLLSIYGSFDAIYSCDQPECPILWGGDVSRSSFMAAVAASERDRAPIFAIHRRALETLGPSTLLAVAHWWVQHGLFTSRIEAVRFVLLVGLRSRLHRLSAKIRRRSPHLSTAEPSLWQGLRRPWRERKP